MPPYQPANLALGLTFTKITHRDTYPAIEPTTHSNHSGRIVFITGASKGIGRATAISYAKAGAEGIVIGARSDLTSVEEDVLAAAKSAGKPAPKVLKLKLDVMDYESVKNAALETEKVFGKLDILINNAGFLSSFDKRIADTDPVEWWMNYEVNIRGVYYITKAFLPLLLKGGEKTIVNLGSVGGLSIRSGGSGYQGTKFALTRFTEHLMLECGEEDILAYVVHPGGVPTELANNMGATMAHLLTDTPDVAADTICFLTTERREWLAARYLSCNWDMPEFLRREEEIVKEGKLLYRMKF